MLETFVVEILQQAKSDWHGYFTSTSRNMYTVCKQIVGKGLVDTEDTQRAKKGIEKTITRFGQQTECAEFI